MADYDQDVTQCQRKGCKEATDDYSDMKMVRFTPSPVNGLHLQCFSALVIDSKLLTLQDSFTHMFSLLFLYVFTTFIPHTQRQPDDDDDASCPRTVPHVK